VITRLVEVARSRGELLRSPIVLVGGTALAGWKIRAHSRDVDIYMPEISLDAVESVEQEFRARHGDRFRLDVTTGENVWGSILLRDIASSPLVGIIDGLELRALRIEDLFLLKLTAGRSRDVTDLDLLAPRTTGDALVNRWNQLIKWHGDRNAILGFADALVVQLRRLFGCDPQAIIARLAITAGQRELLLDTYRGNGSG
jgi:predicted nucleotidyltransferase